MQWYGSVVEEKWGVCDWLVNGLRNWRDKGMETILVEQKGRNLQVKNRDNTQLDFILVKVGISIMESNMSIGVP